MRHWLPILLVAIPLAACGGSNPGDEDAETDAETDADDVTGDGEEEPPEPVAPPTLELSHDPLALTDAAREAIATVPDWLQDDLAINLNRVFVTHQTAVAEAILDVADPKLVDEVAFVAAHSSPEMLEHGLFFPELMELNARLMYEYDTVLDYVELVDEGVPGVDPDFYTTARYLVENEAGTVEERTIDPDTYYWYVVHPRLEDELPLYVDGWSSGTGLRPDMGWFWREFLWDAAAEDCPTDRTCPLLSEDMPGIEVFRRAPESTAYTTDARDTVYTFVDKVLDFGAGSERPIQPNRIYVLSCGNCGEYADFTVASLRTSLIPARNCGASSNDHTWAEWWYQGVGWHGETWFYSRGVRRDRTDNDCDGIADDGLDDTDEDGDGVTVAGGDCNDTLDTVHPGATEVQNGWDDDCDGDADEGFTDADLDGDGDGHSITAGDCDDTDDARHPGADELSNGIDDDCDGTADEGAGAADADADGYTIAGGDCNDNVDTINPGATETTNGIDDDCDGTADDGSDTTDADGDGVSISAGDCDDTDDEVLPGATEIANGIDDDCDGTADEGAGATDADADGYTIAGGDCNDNVDTISPGATETTNGIDDDCDGTADEGLAGSDRDGDGFTMAEGDCNDLAAGTNPDAMDPFLSNNRLYAITTARGDSLAGIDRTGAYATGTSFLDIDVTDRTGAPVDGALVTIYGTWAVYGHPEQWAVASELVTDLAGAATITVGEYNPYGYSVVSAAGDNPGAGYLNPAVDQTLPDQRYDVITNVPGTMPGNPSATEADLTAGADPEVSLNFSLDIESYRIEGDGRLFGSFSQERDGGHVDVFLMDQVGYNRYMTDDAFDAQVLFMDSEGTTEVVDLPRTKDWILVVSNTSFTRSTMVGSLGVSADPADGIAWTEEVPEMHVRLRIPPGEHVAVTLSP
jgi:hypothetical protein